MGTFKITGGHKLKGEIIPQGAKNEALQVLSAVLLTPEEVVIENIPAIRDVNKLIDLLKGLGVTVKQLNDQDYSFTSDNIDLDYLDSVDFRNKAKSIRGSVMIIGHYWQDLAKAIFLVLAEIKSEDVDWIHTLSVLKTSGQILSSYATRIFIK